MSESKKTATCHPDLQHYGLGLCKSCYAGKWRRSHPERVKKHNEKWDAANPGLRRALVDKYNRLPEARYKKAIDSAKRRDVKFTLSLEEFCSAISPECFYCDGFFGRVQQATGLDRLDNSEGYVSSNVVSCCAFCNMLRGDRLTPEETRAAAYLIKTMRQQSFPLETKNAA